MTQEVGIYQTFEFNCWAMGANYTVDYLDMMKKYSPNLHPLPEQMYDKLMQFFDEDYEYNMNIENT